MPKVSVIVPVFGVEEYIERCARSLFEQTLDNIEFLFIDDCTTDRSIEILKEVVHEYPNRESQVIIHRMDQNSGQAAVRNWGVRNATGDYIIHCDSDDWVDKNMLETMYSLAEKKRLDMVICDYCKTDGESKRVYEGCRVTDKWEYLNMLLNAKKSWSLGIRLVSKRIYKNQSILLPSNNMGEDMAVTIQQVYFCDTIGYIDQCYYNYYYNKNSITKKIDNGKLLERTLQSCKNVELLDVFFSTKEDNKKIKSGIIHLKFITRDHILSLVRNKKYYQIWRSIFPEINNKIIFSETISLKEKIRYIMAIFHLYPF